MQGWLRRKSRAEAQQEKPFQQSRFDGGQNSDSVATKIAANEFALSKNTVHTSGDVQGHWGRKLFSPAVTPGSGRLHQHAQHPKTGRWLVHRGNQIWLSTGRDGADWTEVTSLGPDGSLEATGTFEIPETYAVITGGAAAFFSNLALVGEIVGYNYTIVVESDGGTGFNFTLYEGDQPVAMGTESFAGTPTTVILNPISGSGVSGSVDVSTFTSPDVPLNGAATVNPASSESVDFTLRGLTLENTDAWELWWDVVVAAGTATVTLYKDEAMTEAVASGETSNDSNEFTISALNESGIVGYASQISVSLIADGTYTGTALEFSPADVSIDEDSTISPFGDYGFIIFVRGAAGKNVFVDQRLPAYWLLSTSNGYGAFPIAGGGGGAYEYRYLYTYSRIVTLATGEPDYGGNRNSANLEFEGPSNAKESSDTDYSLYSAASPASLSDPINLDLEALVPSPGSPPTPAGANAAAYITHLSIYRTMDVGVNGVGINGEANNTELYIWVADVPIYTLEYTDSTTDDTLRNRLVGASTEQDNLSLRSRLFREMARGIGAIGPDFMVTAEPQAQQASYCDVAVNPRLIGFNFPGTQRFILQDPISEIYRTKDLFVILCPSSTYTSISSINAETGIAGLIPITTIQNFEQASKTLGIKYGQGVFSVDESSFVTLLSDGTVRIFSGSSWGEPLEGSKLHYMTELARVGAVFAFLRNVLLMWYRVVAGPDISGAGAANLSDLVLAPYSGEFLYGKIVAGADTEYTVEFYSDEGRTTLVATAPGDSVDDPQTLTIVPEEDGGPAGSVACDVSGYELPILFTADFRQITSTCIRLGTGGNAGSGWSVIDRPYWAYPGQWCGAMVVEDDDALLRMVAFDYPDNAIFAVEDAYPLRQFEDDVVAVDSGTVTVSRLEEITSTIKIRELIGTQENFTCFHQESHMAVRPRYGQTALPAGLLFTVRGYEAGVLNPGAVTTVQPLDFDIQFFARLQGKQIQVEYESNKSGWRITSFDTLYQSQDMQSASGPWNSLEAGYQEELSVGKVFWLSKGSGVRDRVTGDLMVGSEVAYVDGPCEGLQGIQLPLDGEIVTQNSIASMGDFSILFWSQNVTVNTNESAISIGEHPLIGFKSPDIIELDLIGDYPRVTVPPIGSDWNHFAIIRSGSTVRIYQNGIQLGADIVDASPTVESPFVYASSPADFIIADPFVTNTAISQEALLYYVNDITTNDGLRVLP